MRVVIGVIASVLFLICVSASLVVEKRAVEDILETKERFVDSLEPEQRSWWSENRQKLFDAVANTAVGTSEEESQDDEAVEEMKDFIKSLNPRQQSLWSKLRNKATKIITKYVAIHGTHPAAIELRSLARCGGGCVLSSQCVNWSGGNGDCRCSWFTCSG